jgi:hypothetical protein
MISPGGKLTALAYHPSKRVNKVKELSREYQRGKYHCTIDLLFDWFGLVCFANKKTKIVSSHIADSKPNRRSTVQ